MLIQTLISTGLLFATVLHYSTDKAVNIEVSASEVVISQL